MIERDVAGGKRRIDDTHKVIFEYHFVMWFLIDSGSIALFLVAAVVLAIPLGLSYGPQAALYAEMFPARVRYSGVSVGYALGSILGGAFAATIAQWIIASYGKSWLIGVYLIGLCVVSIAAVSRGRDAMGVDLEVADLHPRVRELESGRSDEQP